jgi:hypothetical protein
MDRNKVKSGRILDLPESSLPFSNSKVVDLPEGQGLKASTKSVSIPPDQKNLTTGSAIKSLAAGAVALERFMGNLKDAKGDPQAILYNISTLLNKAPEELPPDKREDFNLIKSILKGDLKSIAENAVFTASDKLLGSASNRALEILGFNRGGSGPSILNKNLYKSSVGSTEEYNFSRGVKSSVALPKDNQSNVSSGSIKVINENNKYETITRKLKDENTSYRLFNSNNPREWLPKTDDENLQFNDKISENEGKLSSSYKWTSDPYEGEISLDTPSKLKEYLEGSKYGLNFGYKKWAGFEIGTDHLWDIKMKPYNYSNTGARNKDTGNWEGHDGVGSVFGKLPYYYIPQISVDGQITYKRFSFGKNLPVISYELNFGTQHTKDIPLYNNSGFVFPIGFNYNILLSLNIVDDMFHSMKKYLVKCLNDIYDMKKNEAAPFYKAAWEVDLTIFRTGFEKNYRTKLIGCPINYTLIYDGQSEPGATQIHLDLGIVGIVSPSAENVKIGAGVNNWESENTWVQVTLNPNKILSEYNEEKKTPKIIEKVEEVEEVKKDNSMEPQPFSEYKDFYTPDDF